jgi:hypothetical protein
MAFLETSTVGETTHPYIPRLPLILATTEENDIRKRTYLKAYEWKLSDMLESISYLDYVFLSNSTDLKWLRREAFGPIQQHLDHESEVALFLKGKFRAPSTKKKTPISRKKVKQRTDSVVVHDSATQSGGGGDGDIHTIGNTV